MRNLTYYVACSADGYISQKDGSTSSFLTHGEHLDDLFNTYPETIPTHLQTLLGIPNKNNHFDTVLMGRNTYEIGLNEGITSPYTSMQQFVFSTTMTHSPDPSVTLIKDNMLETVKDLKQQNGKDIWLCGGGMLAATLLPEINHLILKVNPCLIHTGIPLFATKNQPQQLELLRMKPYSNGVLLLHYALNA